ncbi:hypothetical protein LJC27_01880 [Christensenellaceae bacterium OttesenSCG-928-M15]|nr:hypothetical protein [Christensenellaceae bacterium OttesenSCG-928-M15]
MTNDFYALIGKPVRIIFADGQVTDGYVSYFTPAHDNDPAIDGLGVVPQKGAPVGEEYDVQDIAQIEIIPAF